MRVTQKDDKVEVKVEDLQMLLSLVKMYRASTILVLSNTWNDIWNMVPKECCNCFIDGQSLLINILEEKLDEI